MILPTQSWSLLTLSPLIAGSIFLYDNYLTASLSFPANRSGTVHCKMRKVGYNSLHVSQRRWRRVSCWTKIAAAPRNLRLGSPKTCYIAIAWLISLECNWPHVWNPSPSTFIVHVCTAWDIISCSPKYHHKLQEIKNLGKDCLQVGLWRSGRSNKRSSGFCCEAGHQ